MVLDQAFLANSCGSMSAQERAGSNPVDEMISGDGPSLGIMGEYRVR